MTATRVYGTLGAVLGSAFPTQLIWAQRELGQLFTVILATNLKLWAKHWQADVLLSLDNPPNFLSILQIMPVSRLRAAISLFRSQVSLIFVIQATTD